MPTAHCFWRVDPKFQCYSVIWVTVGYIRKMSSIYFSLQNTTTLPLLSHSVDICGIFLMFHGLGYIDSRGTRRSKMDVCLLSEAIGWLFTTAWTTVTTVTFSLPSLYLFTRWPEFLSSGVRPFPPPFKSRLMDCLIHRKHGCNFVIYFKSYVSVGGYACIQRPEVDIGGLSWLLSIWLIEVGSFDWAKRSLSQLVSLASFL